MVDDPTLSTLTAFLVVSTFTVALATFLVWRATKAVANATNSTESTMKVVGAYSIMPHISINFLRIEKGDETSDQFVFEVNNDGMGDAFDMKMKISSEMLALTFIEPLDLPRGHKTIVFHNVYKKSKKIEFDILFEDLAGNKQQRIIVINLKDIDDNEQKPPKPVPSDTVF